MSIRVTVITLVILFLSGYAWFRSWFIALCGMIVLMAFLENQDMPRAIGGITGLNLWNVLYVNVVFAWLAQRSREGLEWDLSVGTKRAIMLFWFAIMLAGIRLMLDPTPFYQVGVSSALIAHFINPVKVFLPCLMIYDGCRNWDRIKLALGSVLVANLLLALQSIKYMGIGSLALSGSSLSSRAVRVLDTKVGLHRVDLSMIFAGAFWITLAFALSFSSRSKRLLFLSMLPVIMLGQAVTGGRTGYGTWVLVGIIMCVLKWRRFLPLVPLGAALVILLMPGVQERMLMGFGGQSGAYQTDTDLKAVTSGRSAVWPLVIDEIKEAPLIGYGKEAMQRSGLAEWIEENKEGNPDLSGGFGHPHNAYLEWVLDNGLVGLICVIPIYFIAFRQSYVLFMRGRSRMSVTAGGMGLALLLGLFIAAMGSQTFYPRIGTFGMWVVIGVVWRVWQMEKDAEEAELYNEEDEEEDVDSVGSRRWKQNVPSTVDGRRAGTGVQS